MPGFIFYHLSGISQKKTVIAGLTRNPPKRVEELNFLFYSRVTWASMKLIANAQEIAGQARNDKPQKQIFAYACPTSLLPMGVKSGNF